MPLPTEHSLHNRNKLYCPWDLNPRIMVKISSFHCFAKLFSVLQASPLSPLISSVNIGVSISLKVYANKFKTGCLGTVLQQCYVFHKPANLQSLRKIYREHWAYSMLKQRRLISKSSSTIPDTFYRMFVHWQA